MPMIGNMQPMVGPGMMMGPPPGSAMSGMPPHIKENMMGMPFPKSIPGPLQPQSLKVRIQSIVRDKQKIIEME